MFFSWFYFRWFWGFRLPENVLWCFSGCLKNQLWLYNKNPPP
ncbi:hypothetical protein ACKLNO_00680 [Neisseriaceae bacterium B1]